MTRTTTTARMTPELLEKLHNGDALTDAELVGAAVHFIVLVEMLQALGATWKLARDAAIREDNRLRDMVQARGLQDQVQRALGGTAA